MELSQVTDKLLSNPEKTADWLDLADNYMQRYIENRQDFALPSQHKFLMPLIEKFASDCLAFLAFLVSVRDNFERNSKYFKEVQVVYRRINGRCVQQLRRERLARAVEKAEQTYGRTDYHTRLKWSADLEKKWAKRRLAFLDAARGGKRMSVEDRSELLLEFWKEIDDKIDNNIGILPWQ
jgi:hypothetical protein